MLQGVGSASRGVTASSWLARDRATASSACTGRRGFLSFGRSTARTWSNSPCNHLHWWHRRPPTAPPHKPSHLRRSNHRTSARLASRGQPCSKLLPRHCIRHCANTILPHPRAARPHIAARPRVPMALRFAVALLRKSTRRKARWSLHCTSSHRSDPMTRGAFCTSKNRHGGGAGSQKKRRKLLAERGSALALAAPGSAPGVGAFRGCEARN